MPGHADKKSGALYNKSPYHNQNKGYASQERRDLLKDNPVARTAAGDRPWIAKHYKSGMNYGSPMTDKHSAMEMETPMKKHHSAMKMDSPMKDKHSAMKMDSPMKDKHSAMKMETPMKKHSKAQAERLNPGLASAIHLHDEFTRKNNIKHK